MQLTTCPRRLFCFAAERTCSVNVEWETDAITQSAYPTAFFEAWASSWDAAGVEIPRGLQNEVRLSRWGTQWAGRVQC